MLDIHANHTDTHVREYFADSLTHRQMQSQYRQYYCITGARLIVWVPSVPEVVQL